MSNKPFEKQRGSLVQALTVENIIRSPEVAKAMRTVPREIFLPENVKEGAYIDTPLPIGFGQTISAPHMVALMAEALELEIGQKVLEIGSGSGYNAAVLAEIVAPRTSGKKGHVYTIEIVPKLYVFAKKNIDSLGYNDSVTIILGDGSVSCLEGAPYDRIMVTAAAPEVLKALIEELKVNGIVVIPVGRAYFYQELIKVRKEAENKASSQSLGGVAFVPLIGEKGWKV